MNFRFHFDADKAIQAIGVLMTHDHVAQMNFMRILKLLYLAEREALKEIARPIIGDSVVATERGPVMENVYSLLRGQHSEIKQIIADELRRRVAATLRDFQRKRETPQVSA